MHLPALISVIEVTATSQMSGVVLVKVTVRPLPAIASSAYAVAVALSVVGGLKLMVC